ncbi:putative coiled-coil domain-containing protein 195 [Brachionichthys hirsutus]|uniref:putative coiled-coil domain-containing protein 195 n=1 Tax=Brachionichthys hirsutus TaxID=412623 RepID=UPI00360471EE
MLNPQRQHGELLLHESPVFGKPWFWQRSSSAMESTRSLAEVIMEMSVEIKKLEVENRDLRRLGSVPGKVAAERRTGAEQNPYANLRRILSAPVLEGQYKENTVMTVRRYSISSNPSGVTVREGRAGGEQQNEWGRLQKDFHRGNVVFGRSASGDVGRASNRHSLQEYVHQSRAKVKTVTFLLPVDDIYTNRPVLTEHQEDPKIKELASRTVTGS